MIVLKSHGLTAHLLPYGATLSGLWYGTRSESLVLGSPDAAAYRTTLTYSGAIVGPVANRIGGSRVKIDGMDWQMDANEGTTALHSGRDGLHTRTWNVIEQSEHHALLRCDLPDGACGLPGTRRFEATYTMTDVGTLLLDLTATSDRDTMVNLAHHPYWRLGSSDTVADHRLHVRADHYLPVDGTILPTGAIQPVAGTAYDFRTTRAVPVDQTLDANLCLSRGRRAKMAAAATLTGPDRLTLDIDTTEPGLQVYNGTGLAAAPVRLHSGQTLTPCAGIALEPQSWPDAPNHADFPSILLRAGEKYHQQTRYRISKN